MPWILCYIQEDSWFLFFLDMSYLSMLEMIIPFLILLLYCQVCWSTLLDLSFQVLLFALFYFSSSSFLLLLEQSHILNDWVVKYHIIVLLEQRGKHLIKLFNCFIWTVRCIFGNLILCDIFNWDIFIYAILISSSSSWESCSTSCMLLFTFSFCSVVCSIPWLCIICYSGVSCCSELSSIISFVCLLICCSIWYISVCIIFLFFRIKFF